jgi:hypothetical protein
VQTRTTLHKPATQPAACKKLSPDALVAIEHRCTATLHRQVALRLKVARGTRRNDSSAVGKDNEKG